MSFSVQSFIEKCENTDKDIRHMALFDLNNELQKETFKLDETSQRQISEVVLKLLDDKSTEVQGMAVKCLPTLIKKMNKVQVENSILKLSNNIMNSEDDKRDIAKVALKTVVSGIPLDLAQGPVRKSVETLIKAADGDNIEVKQDALESLADILARFGSTITSFHQSLQDSFMRELQKSKKPSVKKRAITCLATLCVFTSDTLFDAVVNTLIKEIRKNLKGGEGLRTNLQAISSISKTAGQRLAKHLEEIVPLLLKAADEISENENEDEPEDEVRENIMQAFEAFIVRCPEEIKNHVELIIILCKEYVEYDPNFSYDDDEEEEEGEQGDEEQAEDEEDEEMIDDDESDVTWKVRTAAIRVIDSLIKTRPELLNIIYSEFCSEEEHILIDRFKERTESVRLDIFNLFINLLNHTVSITSSASGKQVVNQLPEVSFLKETKSLIIKKLRKQLSLKSAKSRLGIFKVLKSIVTVLQGGLEDHFATLLNPTSAALNEKGDQYSALKLEVLMFLRLALSYHSPKSFTKYYEKLSKDVLQRVNDKYYKVTAEALRATGELVPVLSALQDDSKFGSYLKDIFSAVYEKLSIQDIDQDVKESAITTMSILLSLLGNHLKNNLKDVLPIFLDRLKNEITRLTACKALATIADANLDISVILSDTVEELALYLRKFNRPLRQSALTTLRIMTKSYGSAINNKKYDTVLNELQALISDQDLHLAHLALQLTSQILNSNPKIASQVNNAVLPKVLELIESSTLQGSALESLLTVLKQLAPTSGFSSLLNSLLGRVKGVPFSKQVYTNVGRSVAALCSEASEKDTSSTISKFTKDLSNSDDSVKMLAMFTLGELGRKTDLSGNKKVQQDIEAFFDSGTEVLKNAASYALGNISVGNLEKFVPHILNEIKSNSNRKYLLIHSLKEVIVQAEAENLKPFIADSVSLLFENCDNEEEGIRNVVSECLGKLTLADYNVVMPKLKSLLGENELKKAAVVSAVKFAITDQPKSIDTNLKTDVQDFLKCLNKSESVTVRRAAVLLLNSAAHNKPLLLRDTLSKHLPNLYEELVFDPSLIKVIKLGPFNHKVDQGIELRKSAYETLDTVLDTYKGRIDIGKFLQHLPSGLDDPNSDIKMLSHLMTVKVSNMFSEELSQYINAYVKPICTTIKTKPKKLDQAVQQEKERHEELLKSAFKAIIALGRVKGVEDNSDYSELMNKVIPNEGSLKTLYKTVLDAEEGDGTPFME